MYDRLRRARTLSAGTVWPFLALPDDPESRDISSDEIIRDKTLVKSRTFRERYQLSLSLAVYASRRRARARAGFLVAAARRSRGQAHRRKIPGGKAFRRSAFRPSHRARARAYLYVCGRGKNATTVGEKKTRRNVHARAFGNCAVTSESQTMEVDREREKEKESEPGVKFAPDGEERKVNLNRDD